MTGPDRHQRAPRGCVVLVGDVPEPGGNDAARPQRVVRADNLFDAVGEVTIATAQRPVEAVVMPADLVGETAAATVEAFRRIDPSVRLFLLAASREEAGRLKDHLEGFDDVLVAPLASAELGRVLAQESSPPAAALNGPGGGSGAPASRPVVDPDTEDRTAAPPTGEPDVTETDVVIEIPDRGDIALPRAGAGMPAPADQPLGDTDLVEAIMTDPEGVRRRAMELMRQQTRWTDLELSESSKDDGRASIEVASGPTSYGVLTTAGSDARGLRPWAQWLARWLALDQAFRDYRTMSYQDDLTGAGNRRFFNTFMRQTIRNAKRTRRAVTVLVFDIDDFKRYNDQFGHEAGDEVLRETVRLLKSVIRSGDRVCRIGGDEFVVIFGDPEGPREVGSNPPEAVEVIATRFQDQICRMKFPKLGLDAPGTLSISGGLATFPWDGTDPESLLRHADQLALQSKRAGKNVITIGSQKGSGVRGQGSG